MVRNSFAVWCGALVVLCLIIGAAPAGSSFYPRAREDPAGDQWLWGNLTWSGERGGIHWGPSPDTSELGGSGAQHGATDASPPPGDDFVSEPLPRAIYYDPSRLVQVDVLIKTPPDNPTNPPQVCQWSEGPLLASVWLGSRLIGGGVYSAPFYGDFDEGPPPPDGFYVCRTRFPLEQTLFPAGSVLTLRLNYTATGPFEVGVSKETPSMVRVPFFTPEQAAYRFPEIIPRERPGGASTNPGNGLIGGLGLAAPFGVVFARPGRRQKLILGAALLLAGAAAGCMGGKTAPAAAPADTRSSPNVSVSVLEPGGSGLADGANGSIIGQVSDLYAIPVERAHVALLGTVHGTSTDRDGLFALKGLPTDSYILHIDAEFFSTVEARVAVQAGRVTKVDVSLPFDEGLDAGERPHRHDYWLGTDEKTLYKGPIGPDPFLIPHDDSADHNMVRPGTREVEVVLKFEESVVGFSKVGLAYQDNADPNPNNWSVLYPRASGEPFHIMATWETTDVGHQLFSTWAFSWYAMQVHQTTGPTQTGDPIEATITIKRGAIPLEPRHPNPWGDGSSLRVMSGETWQERGTWWVVGFGAAQIGLCLAHSNPYDSTPMEMAPTRPIPPDAKTVRFFANFSRPNSLLPQPAPTHGWELWFKTGEAPPEAYAEGSPLFVKGPPGTSSADGSRWMWEVSVGAGKADGVYNKKSAWRAIVVPDDWSKRCADAFAYYNLFNPLSPTQDWGNPLILRLDAVALKT